MAIIENNIAFNDTPAGMERRVLRSLIRKSKSMTKMEREIMLWIMERWFYHRGGAGVVHPGAEKISKGTEWCVRSVRYVLKRLRDWGFIVAVKYAKGGRNATRYMVDEEKILRTLGDIPEVAEGSLSEVNRPENGDDKPCMGCRRYNNSETLPKPADQAKWLTWRFAEGVALGLKRRISPSQWLKRQKQASLTKPLGTGGLF